MLYDTIIVGSGAAGLSAGIYAGRYLMKTLIVRGEFGGETAKAGVIWNYPGTPSIDGYTLMKNMEAQAKEAGAEIVGGEVTTVRKESDKYLVTVVKGSKSEEYSAKTIIFTLGSKRRRMGLPLEDELTSKGVHYCVTCDGPLYADKIVAVVGGGDASAKGVLHLSDYAKHIYYIVRGDKLRAEPVNQEAVKKLGDKVTMLMNTKIEQLIGSNKLEKVILDHEVEGSKELVLDGLFVEIGADPDTKAAVSLGVELDKLGYISVDNVMQTNVAGAYAGGDAVNHFGQFKQSVTAAALGAVAATSAYNYIKKNEQ
jgi:thioredoxin reductase (NADPH)